MPLNQIAYLIIIKKKKWCVYFSNLVIILLMPMLGHMLQDDTAEAHDIRHPSYSLDFSSTDCHFFNHLDPFLRLKTFCSKGGETAIKKFSLSKPLEFYRTSINNLVIQW